VFPPRNSRTYACREIYCDFWRKEFETTAG
jgi:hypothetical protein